MFLDVWVKIVREPNVFLGKGMVEERLLLSLRGCRTGMELQRIRESKV